MQNPDQIQPEQIEEIKRRSPHTKGFNKISHFIEKIKREQTTMIVEIERLKESIMSEYSLQEHLVIHRRQIQEHRKQGEKINNLLEEIERRAVDNMHLTLKTMTEMFEEHKEGTLGIREQDMIKQNELQLVQRERQLPYHLFEMEQEEIDKQQILKEKIEMHDKQTEWRKKEELLLEQKMIDQKKRLLSQRNQVEQSGFRREETLRSSSHRLSRFDSK